LVGAIDSWLASPGLVVVYDGECPFCTAYVRLLRLKESVGPVTLVDARQRPDVTADMTARGLDINQGMLAIYGSQIHAGDAAMTLLSLLSTRSGTMNRAMARLFANPGRSRLLYPALRTGRGLALRLLGRKPIA
jgi:predicted DCC family thiol-disulfide oxidoreductase YuxK